MLPQKPDPKLEAFVAEWQPVEVHGKAWEFDDGDPGIHRSVAPRYSDINCLGRSGVAGTGSQQKDISIFRSRSGAGTADPGSQGGFRRERRGHRDRLAPARSIIRTALPGAGYSRDGNARSRRMPADGRRGGGDFKRAEPGRV